MQSRAGSGGWPLLAPSMPCAMQQALLLLVGSLPWSYTFLTTPGTQCPALPDSHAREPACAVALGPNPKCLRLGAGTPKPLLRVSSPIASSGKGNLPGATVG